MRLPIYGQDTTTMMADKDLGLPVSIVVTLQQADHIAAVLRDYLYEAESRNGCLADPIIAAALASMGG